MESEDDTEENPAEDEVVKCNFKDGWISFGDPGFPDEKLTDVPPEKLRGNDSDQTVQARSKYFNVPHPIKLSPIEWFFE